MSGQSGASATVLMLTPTPTSRPAGTPPHVVAGVALFQARDVVRSRWLAAYGLFFLLVTEALLRFTGGSAAAVLSLASIVLYVVPLVTLVFGTVYMYNAREFTALLLAQPVKRRDLFLGLYAGLTVPLCLAIVAGLGAPFVLRSFNGTTQLLALTSLIGAAMALTASFAAIALSIALAYDDRLRGLGTAVGVWLLGAIVYDGLVLTAVAAFADYPLERPLLALTLANPIDLARVALLLQLDISALMGYTGAVLQKFLGSGLGALLAVAALTAWIIVPVMVGARAFDRKDF